MECKSDLLSQRVLWVVMSDLRIRSAEICISSENYLRGSKIFQRKLLIFKAWECSARFYKLARTMTGCSLKRLAINFEGATLVPWCLEFEIKRRGVLCLEQQQQRILKHSSLSGRALARSRRLRFSTFNDSSGTTFQDNYSLGPPFSLGPAWKRYLCEDKFTRVARKEIIFTHRELPCFSEYYVEIPPTAKRWKWLCMCYYSTSATHCWSVRVQKLFTPIASCHHNSSLFLPSAENSIYFSENMRKLLQNGNYLG